MMAKCGSTAQSGEVICEISANDSVRTLDQRIGSLLAVR